MDLTELWWSLLGLAFLVTPFIVAAFGGVALPAGVVVLARGSRLWSDETKLACLLGTVLLTTTIGVGLLGQPGALHRAGLPNQPGVGVCPI
jgi:hypothetical protein